MVGISLLSAAPADAAGVTPPSDNYATGYVGLCNRHGQNVTSGSIYAKPFIWRAVSSAAAPEPFNSGGRKATLYAFQPRPDVDASQWSGTTLTAATPYTNPGVPMVQSSYRDFGLSDYLNSYPPEVDGIVELRILYSSSDTGFATSYAASFIQVRGTTWHLVKGGSVHCTAGSASSPEAHLPKYDKAGLQPPQLLSAAAAKAVGAPTDRAANVAARDIALGKKVPATSSAAATSSGPSAPSSDPGEAGDSGSTSAVDSTGSSSGGSHAALITAIVVALALLGGAALWWRRSRPATGTH